MTSSSYTKRRWGKEAKRKGLTTVNLSCETIKWVSALFRRVHLAHSKHSVTSAITLIQKTVFYRSPSLHKLSRKSNQPIFGKLGVSALPMLFKYHRHSLQQPLGWSSTSVILLSFSLKMNFIKVMYYVCCVEILANFFSCWLTIHVIL